MTKNELQKKMKPLKSLFSLETSGMKRIMERFRTEMEKGLSGKSSSLRMLPTYVTKPSGNEKGKFIALDLGGTNFRVLEVELKGGGRTSEPKIMKFILDKKRIVSGSGKFFDFIAKAVSDFLIAEKIRLHDAGALGFTFSFPVKQTGIASGKLVCWTKGFNVAGVVGRDVVGLLNEAFIRKGIGSIKVAALVNDTVGTLASAAYEDADCDIGIILGTGTNACYLEDTKRIPKLGKIKKEYSSKMVVNIEWGNFNKLDRNIFDKMLDKGSSNPGKQILEKMVSGMYLGELARLVLYHLSEAGALFSPHQIKVLSERNSFKTEYMSIIESDRSMDLGSVNGLLKQLNIMNTTVAERKAVRRVCSLLSDRAARLSAACAASILVKIDAPLSARHTIAIDGSVYEKHPHFREKIASCLKDIFGKKASLVKLAHSKDGSGKGAAIIAAVASGRTHG